MIQPNMMLWWITVASLVGNCQSKIMRYRRRVLNVDALPTPPTAEANHVDAIRGLHYRSPASKKKKNKTMKKEKGRKKRCDTGDYWSDLLDCGRGDFSFSMPDTFPPPAPTISIPSPSGAIVPISVPTPDLPASPSITVAPLDTIPIGSGRSDAIINAIELIVPNVVTRPTEPEGRALGWLLLEDEQVGPFADSTDNLIQRYLCALLYYSTGGPEWTDSQGWLSSTSVCTWMGVECNASGSITGLSLAENNLRGTLPSELRHLRDLQGISMFRNGLSGTIPSLAEFSTLQSIDLEENELVGPAFVSLPTSMASYRVSLNQLTGTIPNTLPPTMRELWAAGNNLSGTIPSSLGSSSFLESLILFGSNLSGTIPSELGELNGLSRLQLYMNNLSGTIPNDLYRLTSIAEIRLERNNLDGTLSSSIGNWQNLADLRLGENRFNGSIPPELWSITNLAVLLANATNFVGTIPDTFAEFSNLVFLDLSSNMIMGTIPASIFDTDIQFLYLADNAFTGTIPESFTDATALRDLYIYGNELTGTVPSAQGANDLSTLSEFRLENNLITGTIPEELCALRGDVDSGGDALTTLFADCGGAIPRIRCDCCNGCSDP